MVKPADISARAWAFALDHESDTDGCCMIPTEQLARAFDAATADMRGVVHSVASCLAERIGDVLAADEIAILRSYTPEGS